jgi:hypothetical protein
MVRSGLIFGAVALLLVIGAALVTPLCAPCVGLVMGLVAGYMAGIFDKPFSSGESIKKGGIAGAIAGGLGFVGGMLGGVINSIVLDPANVEAFNNLFGITTTGMNQTGIWASQLALSFCVGLFNVVWMAIMGVAGGALWYQITGKNQKQTVLPPQEPIQPNF